MSKVLSIGRKVKSKRKRVKEILGEGFEDQEREVKVQLIQELIPLGLMHVEKVLQEEVEELA
ncbi:MAG: hypothetical protein ACE5QV_09970, partial [Fidelibacterota bacterium]